MYAVIHHESDFPRSNSSAFKLDAKLRAITIRFLKWCRLLFKTRSRNVPERHYTRHKTGTNSQRASASSHLGKFRCTRAENEVALGGSE